MLTGKVKSWSHVALIFDSTARPSARHDHPVEVRTIDVGQCIAWCACLPPLSLLHYNIIQIGNRRSGRSGGWNWFVAWSSRRVWTL